MELHEERRVDKPTKIKVKKSGLYSLDGRVRHLRGGTEVQVRQWLQFLSDDAMHPDDLLPFDD